MTFGRKKKDQWPQTIDRYTTRYYDVWVTDANGDVHKFCDVREFYSGAHTTGITLHWFGDDQRSVYIPAWNISQLETKLNREEITEVAK